MTDEVRSGTLAGRHIAGYQVLALLGAGGMGDVYRARDTRLKRDVALKVLHRDRAGDPAQQARFRREAQAASALNHPSIIAVYDVGVEDGIPFIITELVDGTSLREVMERGPLPIKEVLGVATQIADGLTAAHEADIVHRDLKPDNVMLTADGRVKILDFGLALASLSTTPVGNGPLPVTQTEFGLIEGTVPYMSPEQARGTASDFRSDQFAFGLVLYEMTTGARAFRRETPVQTLSAIIADEAPPIADLTSRAPAQLRWLIERCLAKDPRQRYAATRDLAQDLRTLKDRLAETTTGASAVADAARRRSTVGILLVVVATIAALALGIDVWLRLRPTDSLLTRFDVRPPSGGSFVRSSAFMAVSPDGRSLVFVASSPDCDNCLWLRQFGSAIRPLLGTEHAGQPYWSADSRFVAFGVDRKTKTIDVASGAVKTLDEAVGSGTWNSEGVILGPRTGEGLYRIPAARGGGSAKPVTTLDVSRGETAHTWPYFLPDGRHFLFLATSLDPRYDGALWVGSLDSTQQPKRLLDKPVDSNVAYAAGFLIYMRASTLFAQRFNADRQLVSEGEPEWPIATNVERTPGSRRGAFSVSQAGDVLAYRQIGETQLSLFDRDGHRLDSIGSNAFYGNPALSPDEHTVAVNRRDPATDRADIWLIDLSGNSTPFPLEPSNESSDELMPLWFPDRSRLVFRSNKKAPPSQPAGPGLYSKALSGAGPDELLRAGIGVLGSPLGVSHDRSFLLYQAWDPKTLMDLWILPLTGDRKPKQFLSTRSDEFQGQLSPSEQWIAYVSDATSTKEVYVRRFPSGDDPRPISKKGGLEPQWGKDGTELYYLAPDRDHCLMRVAMNASTGEPGPPICLFETRMSTATDHPYTRNQYAVLKDGRLLINQPAAGESPASITVLLNWTTPLKKR